MALFQVTMKGKLWGQDCKNVVHFVKPDGVQNDMIILAAKVSEFWIGHLRNTQTQHFTWTEQVIVHISDNPWPPLVQPLNVGGTFFAATSSAAFMCFVYQFRAANFLSRRGRGRFYVSGIYPELENGLWTSSRINFMDSVLGVWRPQFTGSSPSSGFNLVIRGRHESESDVREVVSIIPRTYPGVQRRRNLHQGS